MFRNLDPFLRIQSLSHQDAKGSKTITGRRVNVLKKYREGGDYTSIKPTSGGSVATGVGN
jgi:hypothetical protein